MDTTSNSDAAVKTDDNTAADTAVKTEIKGENGAAESDTAAICSALGEVHLKLSSSFGECIFQRIAPP